MPNVSYAQNREDVLLNRVFPEAVGFYIDVGAADPVELSVTKWFYDRGWSGINIEPQTGYFAALTAARPRDINLNVLVSDAPGEVTLYELPARPLLSTPDPVTAEQFREAGDQVVPRTVPAVTLAEVCERYVRGPIDFLKIDVEGHEAAVLRGADFTRWRPIVLVIEATESERPTPNHGPWEPLVLSAGYQFATFDGLNRYYVREESAHLVPKLQLPVNLFDRYFETHHQVRERIALQEAVEYLSGECAQLQQQLQEKEAVLLRALADAAEVAEARSQANEARQQAADAAARAQRLERTVAEQQTRLDELDRGLFGRLAARFRRSA